LLEEKTVLWELGIGDGSSDSSYREQRAPSGLWEPTDSLRISLKKRRTRKWMLGSECVGACLWVSGAFVSVSENPQTLVLEDAGGRSSAKVRKASCLAESNVSGENVGL
jgi:hypothetical protein